MTLTDHQPSEIVALAREKLAVHLRDEAGQTLRGLTVLRTYPKPFSVTTYLLADTSQGSRRYVMKQALYNPASRSLVGGRKQAIVEYNVLKRIHPKFVPIPKCSVPRPVAVLPEQDAYVMEFVDGHLLEDDLRFLHYFANRARFRELAESFYQSGCWLRHFQEFTRRRTAAMEALDGVLKRCQNRLKLIEERRDPRCPKDLRKRVTQFMDEQIAELAGCQIEVAGRHGDFGPWNVMVDHEGVTVLDFFGYEEAPLPVDILKMLLKLEADEMHLANSPRRVRRVREAFLAGMGPLPVVPRAVVTICEAMHRVCHLYSALSTVPARLLHRRQFRRSIRCNLTWLLSRGQTGPPVWPL